MTYLLLAFIAAAGFIASLMCHVMGWLQINPPGGNSVFILHAGFIILWFPLVIFANRTMPNPGRGNLEHLLAELPKWVRVSAGVLAGYTVLNFAYFIYSSSQFPRHKTPFLVELRGFSGHWMLFYGIATAGYVALARLGRKRR